MKLMCDTGTDVSSGGITILSVLVVFFIQPPYQVFHDTINYRNYPM